MKGISVMIRRMDMEYFILKMEATMKESGSMIKCMVLEDSIIRMAKLLMKAIGKTINLMGKGESIIHSLFLLNNSSTTKIYLNLGICGHTMKDNLKTILSMEKAI